MIKAAAWTTGALLLASVGAGSAGAMPLAPATSLEGQASVTLVRDGCGPGGFRNRYGECRYRGGYGGGYGRGPGFYEPHRAFGRDDGYGYGYGRRCFIRETYDGPRRVCRW